MPKVCVFLNTARNFYKGKTMDNNGFKQGDEIVRFGFVWRIFKIKQQKGQNGQNEETAFYQPVFRKNQNGKLNLSIPIKNIRNTLIRRPVSKKEANSLLKDLRKKPETEIKLDLNRIKEKLELNSFTESMTVLKNLWWNQKENFETFTKSKKNVLDLAIKKLSEEVAFVYKLPLTKAKQKIKEALGD